MDSVMDAVRTDFDEMGIEDAILYELQQSWERKVVATRVADFSTDERLSRWVRPAGPTPGNPEDGTEGNSDIKPVIAPNGNAVNGNGSSASASASNVAVSGSSTGSANGTNGTNGANGNHKQRKHQRVKDRAPDDDEIGSDLDDPDEEDDVDEEGEGDGNGDLVIALYDKVQRVKNKWKVTLKDGIASVNGKDYLFSKCQGEFEW